MKKENFLIYISHKTPNAPIFPQKTVRPTICLEVGYPEPYQKLLQDADLLLERFFWRNRWNHFNKT